MGRLFVKTKYLPFCTYAVYKSAHKNYIYAKITPQHKKYKCAHFRIYAGGVKGVADIN